jgi:uncharacterized protein YecE (DUF72 family)
MTNAHRRNFRAGTSGWSYPQWKHTFYQGCPQREWLHCYSGHFSSVELNSSYYRLPAEQTARHWAEMIPAGFLICAKAWRGITHYARLRHCENKLGDCLKLFRLFGDKLGPVLFQLPASFKRDDAVLADFLKLMPDDIEPVFEFRHRSWQHDDIFAQLEKAGATLCHSHMKTWLTRRILTSPMLYIRMHGTRGWFNGAYSERALRMLASYIRKTGVKKAFVFFNNTFHDDDALKNAAFLDKLLHSV